MTIHQLPGRCWELQPPTDEERYPHFDTEAEALADLKEDRENHEQAYADTKPVQLDAPCWVVQCDGECETVLDEEGEGWTFHHDSRADAETTAAAYDFRHVGDSVFCDEDAPEDSALLLSPAEREAAGQLVLPGVLP